MKLTNKLDRIVDDRSVLLRISNRNNDFCSSLKAKLSKERKFRNCDDVVDFSNYSEKYIYLKMFLRHYFKSSLYLLLLVTSSQTSMHVRTIIDEVIFTSISREKFQQGNFHKN